MAATDEIPTAQFDSSHALGRFLLSTGLLSKAWDASIGAHECGKPFVLYDLEDVGFIAFSGSEALHGFISGNTEFGEGSINKGNDLFNYIKDNNGEPALVHEGLLHGFLNLIRNSDLPEKIEGCRRQKQRIVLTGHCLGGAMADFATLWMLGNASQSQGRRPRLPFCVTFGGPLMGDQRLAQAIGREKWCGQFCHVVSKHDVIPRVLAPFPSLNRHLKALLSYIYSEFKPNHNQLFCPLSKEDTTIFLATILQRAKIAANEDNCGIINKSPYKPFGYYLFSSEKGAACMESRAAVLQMLYFTLQDIDMRSSAFLTEHIDYGKLLERNLRNLISGGITMGQGLCDVEDPYEMGIAMALEAAGVETQNSAAREALTNTGRIGINPSINRAKLHVQSSKIQGARVEIEWYKASCERQGRGYYDAFKSPSNQKDFRANIDRIKISRFWNDLIEMVATNQVPDDFLRNKWIYAGTYYRQLVEPLDIALYYRSGKHKKCGHYLQGQRPSCYSTLEKWLQDSNLGREKIVRTELAVLTQDSCFWARLEEARDWLAFIKEENDGVIVLEVMDKIQRFVNHVGKLIEARDISYDVLLEEGSLMKWWRDYRDICERLLPFPSHPHRMELQLIENEMRKLVKIQ